MDTPCSLQYPVRVVVKSMNGKLWRSLLLLLAALNAGCSSRTLEGIVHSNQPPTVELTQAPSPSQGAGTYVYELSWAGFDPDGRVVGYFYAVDPPTQAATETTWVSTTENRATFVFRSDSVGTGVVPRGRGFHTVAVRCVDDAGAHSPVVYASFTTTTVAPTVALVSPVPSSLLAIDLAPSIRIRWLGRDPDGVGTELPATYRWRLFSELDDIALATVLADPDSIRRRFAPDFEGWNSLPGTETGVTVRDLVPGHSYVFVIVAIDVAGAYSPVFRTTDNMLWFDVVSRSSLGPIVSINSTTFAYTFASGGIFVDPPSWVRAECAASRPIQINWSAKPEAGGFIRSFRWAVDIKSIDDETPRSDEANDLAHWSRPSLDLFTVLAPYNPAVSESHLFYLEANDDLGFRSLVVVQIRVVRPTFDRDLLIVDDTWFTPDRRLSADCVAGPTGVWPSAAELDTFLYATGGKPYRCYLPGTSSPAGLFAGYTFDTLGTHVQPVQAALSLQTLDRYRNLIWICDLNSALTHNDIYNVPVRPMPLLRAWTTPPSANPLATWIQQGGRLWLMGGGAAMASLRAYDALHSPIDVFSAGLGELGPGRLMWDGAHWRSEITVTRSFRAVRSDRARGDWAGAPDYGRLPAVLLEKSPDTDPLPPQRSGNFYLSQYAAEHLSKPNRVIEGGSTAGVAVLDTLYETQGGTAGDGWPIMTLYHGRDTSVFVFSGFPLWYFQRTQAIDVVDFVLQQVWGLSRRPVAR